MINWFSKQQRDQKRKEAQDKKLREERYSSFDKGDGLLFEKGDLSFSDLHKIAISQTSPQQISGRQELFENIINDFI